MGRKNLFPPKARQNAHRRLVETGHWQRCTFCNRMLGTRAGRDDLIRRLEEHYTEQYAWALAATDVIEPNGYCTGCQKFAKGV